MNCGDEWRDSLVHECVFREKHTGMQALTLYIVRVCVWRGVTELSGL